MHNAPKKTSRREWFRLRHSPQAHFMGNGDGSDDLADDRSAANRLQSVESPPNYDGMNLDDLPPVREALLSAQDLDALFDDILRYGSDVQLLQRRSTTETPAAQNLDSSLRRAKDWMRWFVNRFLILDLNVLYGTKCSKA